MPPSDRDSDSSLRKPALASITGLGGASLISKCDSNTYPLLISTEQVDFVFRSVLNEYTCGESVWLLNTAVKST